MFCGTDNHSLFLFGAEDVLKTRPKDISQDFEPLYVVIPDVIPFAVCPLPMGLNTASSNCKEDDSFSVEQLGVTTSNIIFFVQSHYNSELRRCVLYVHQMELDGGKWVSSCINPHLDFTFRSFDCWCDRKTGRIYFLFSRTWLIYHIISRKFTLRLFSFLRRSNIYASDAISKRYLWVQNDDDAWYEYDLDQSPENGVWVRFHSDDPDTQITFNSPLISCVVLNPSSRPFFVQVD